MTTHNNSNSLIIRCLIIKISTNNNINLDYARLCKRDIFVRDNNDIVYIYRRRGCLCAAYTQMSGGLARVLRNLIPAFEMILINVEQNFQRTR